VYGLRGKFSTSIAGGQNCPIGEKIRRCLLAYFRKEEREKLEKKKRSHYRNSRNFGTVMTNPIGEGGMRLVRGGGQNKPRLKI